MVVMSSFSGLRGFAPDAGEGGLDLLLEAGDQFAVGGHQRLLGFDLRHDGTLRGEGRDLYPANRRAKGPFYPSLGQRPRFAFRNVRGLKARSIVGVGDGAGLQPFGVLGDVFLGRCPRLG